MSKLKIIKKEIDILYISIFYIVFQFQISYAIQNCSISLGHLANICHTCNKSFTKERDKLVMTRTAVFEFVQALKFKIAIPDANFLLLANLVLQVSNGIVNQ